MVGVRELAHFVSYKSAQKISEDTLHLTSREDYRLIQEVNITIYNVKQTKNALQRLLNIKKGTEEIQELLMV